MRRILRTLCVSGFVLALLPLGGCSHTRWPSHMEKGRSYLERALEHRSWVRVKPWERGVLSLEEMAWQPDPLRATRSSHIHFSKEAALPGGSAGGGGCGCN